jgi:methionyl aminopeptidase
MTLLKTSEEIKIMAEGGAKLGRVKDALGAAVDEGVRASEIEKLAVDLIQKEGAEASFKLVPGYSWATCVNVNSGLVHGIPKEEVVFKKGDVVSVDVGIYFKGFHTDTSLTVGVSPSQDVENFLKVGKATLEVAIAQAKPGNHIYNISKAIEDGVTKAGYSAIRALVGHGVGRELHEEPHIPCFVPGRIEDSPKITSGMVLAIEVMYALGSPEVVQLSDGWTIGMRDGKISGLFEETVAVMESGPQVLTR